jgi:SAM-dependent methyltransferase
MSASMSATDLLASQTAVPACPSCASSDVRVFYRVDGAPVHSVLLMNTPEIAKAFPRRNIALGLCRHCGFISNTEFDPSVHSYSGEYEETQGFSPTFRAFHEKLAANIIESWGIHDKTVIEVGCGKGEFLSLLCRLGNNRGIGIDPAFVAERNPARDCEVEFIADFYSEEYADRKADAIICKMTLEHIPQTFDFVSLVRRSIGEKQDTIVFFQVPDAQRILSDTAFQDIYYEHCSYFTASALARLFRRCGFEVREVKTEYDGQYLTIVAQPARTVQMAASATSRDTRELERQVDAFSARSTLAIQAWKKRVRRFASEGRRAVIWGSGSKGVAFLTATGADEEISYVVDINPYRQGKFMAGTGHRIVSPAQLRTEPPDVVIAMNSIYRNEIQRSLDELGVRAELLAL